MTAEAPGLNGPTQHHLAASSYRRPCPVAHPTTMDVTPANPPTLSCPQPATAVTLRLGIPVCTCRCAVVADAPARNATCMPYAHACETTADDCIALHDSPPTPHASRHLPHASRHIPHASRLTPHAQASRLAPVHADFAPHATRQTHTLRTPCQTWSQPPRILDAELLRGCYEWERWSS